MSRARSQRPARIAAALAILLIGPLVWAANPDRISGALPEPEHGWTPTDVLEATRARVACQIRYLDREARRSAIRASLGTAMDLFPGPTGAHEGPPGYFVFALEMSNLGTEDVTFNPCEARMATEKGDVQF